MNVERREEERRYDEAATEETETLDLHVLENPVRVLRRRPSVDVAPGERLADALARMVDAKQGCAIVVEERRVVGIFTERDALTRVLAPGRDPAAVTVADVMTPDPECLTLDDTIGYALHKMSVGGFRHLPVVGEDGAPVGVLSQREGVQYLVGFFPEAVVNQPPRSIAQRPPQNQHGG